MPGRLGWPGLSEEQAARGGLVGPGTMLEDFRDTVFPDKAKEERGKILGNEIRSFAGLLIRKMDAIDANNEMIRQAIREGRVPPNMVKDYQGQIAMGEMTKSRFQVVVGKLPFEQFGGIEGSHLEKTGMAETKGVNIEEFVTTQSGKIMSIEKIMLPTEVIAGLKKGRHEDRLILWHEVLHNVEKDEFRVDWMLLPLAKEAGVPDGVLRNYAVARAVVHGERGTRRLLDLLSGYAPRLGRKLPTPREATKRFFPRPVREGPLAGRMPTPRQGGIPKVINEGLSSAWPRKGGITRIVNEGLPRWWPFKGNQRIIDRRFPATPKPSPSRIPVLARREGLPMVPRPQVQRTPLRPLRFPGFPLPRLPSLPSLRRRL